MSEPERVWESGAIPRQVGPYEILSLLGQGSWASVYLARRSGIERLYALKLIEEGPALDDEARLRLEREARVASRLEHPGIVRALDVGRVPGALYLVMDYVSGPTLREWLAERAGLTPWQDACRLIEQVARAVHAAHEANVIHRDLKPANVIVDGKTGQPRITDFGVARDVKSGLELTTAGETLGTPYYMSPEQLRGDGAAVDARADVFSLGVMLYELLTGRKPYPASSLRDLTLQVERGGAPPPSELSPDVPGWLDRLCKEALAPDPGRRPRSALVLAERLASQGRPPSGRRASHGASAHATATASATASAGAEGGGLRLPSDLQDPGALAGSHSATVNALPAGLTSWLPVALAGVAILAGLVVWAGRASSQRRVLAQEVAGLESQLRSLPGPAPAESGSPRPAAPTRRRVELERALEDSERNQRQLEQALSQLLREVDEHVAADQEPLGTLAAVVDRVIVSLSERRESGCTAMAVRLLRNRGRYGEALDLAREAQAEGDPDPDLLVLEFRSLARIEGLSKETVAPITKLLRWVAADPEARKESPQGIFARFLGETELSEAERLELLERGVERYPDKAYLPLLRCYRVQQDPRARHDRSELELRRDLASRAVAADPTSPEAREERVDALLELWLLQPEQPLAEWDQLLTDLWVAREVSQDTAHWMRTGRAMLQAGRPRAALVWLETARRAHQATIRRRALPTSDPRLDQLIGAVAAWRTQAFLALGEQRRAVSAAEDGLSKADPLTARGLRLKLGLASPATRERILQQLPPQLRPLASGDR